MRIRFTTWSLAVLLVGSAAIGYGASLPRNASGDASAAPTAKAKAAPSKAAPKPATAPVRAAASATKSSAKRRVTRKVVVRQRLQLAPTASRISEIQAALSREGAYQGDPNGRWDSTTIDAMRHFQTDHGLNPSGRIDALTLQKLGLGSQVSGLGAPVPASVPQASAADTSQTEQRP